MESYIQILLDLLFSDQRVGQFLCILARTSSFLLLIPIFSASFVPAPLKLLLMGIISFILVPLVPLVYHGNLFMDVGFQVVVGLMMGFFTRFIFDGIILGTEMASIQMGLGFASLVNPLSGEQTNPLSQVYTLALITLFLAINGHYILLMGLAKSFKEVNIHFIMDADSLLMVLSDLIQKTFFIGFRVALPMFTAILFMQIGLGLLHRTVPQMNAFALSLSLNIVVAFVILVISNREIMTLSTEWNTEIAEFFGQILSKGY